MNRETQLKVQSFLDGELPPGEAREVAALIQQDPAAAGVLAELRNTRAALRQAEPAATVAASREFYWSKIKQDIERLGEQPPARRESWLLAKLRFLVLPAAAITVLIILGLALHYHARPAGTLKPSIGNPANPDTALANPATNGAIAR